MLTGRALITSAERHYLKHVVARQEWPVGTSMADYVQGVREMILDPRSGVFTSRYARHWQLGVVRAPGVFLGPRGGELVLVEYRVGLGYWTTVHQLRNGLPDLNTPARGDIRWLPLSEPLT
jgi:hypothetical protein